MNYGFSLFSVEPKLRGPVEFVLSEHRRSLIWLCPSQRSCFCCCPCLRNHVSSATTFNPLLRWGFLLPGWCLLRSFRILSKTCISVLLSLQVGFYYLMSGQNRNAVTFPWSSALLQPAVLGHFGYTGIDLIWRYFWVLPDSVSLSSLESNLAVF